MTRRFWPYSGSTEFAVGELASAIKTAGHDPSIVTIRWEKNWPTYFQFEELPVIRVNRPATGPWGSFRYLRSLSRQLLEMAPDGIIVFGLGNEAWSISKTFGDKIPFVIRIDNHLLGHHRQQPVFSIHQLAALNTADRVLVESEWTENRIANHPSVKTQAIKVVPDGVAIDWEHQRTPARHGSARVAISDAHPILMIEGTQPLVVCAAPLSGDEGMLDLVNAWSRVIDRYPKARLWIIGDGKKGRPVWERLLEKHMVNSVIMPGSFDDLNEVFQAADVYVHPLRSDESCGFLTRALVKGVCSVVTNTKATQKVVENNVTGLVVGQRDPRALADAIKLAIDNKDLRERLGRTALKSMVSAYDINQCVGHFIEPFLNHDKSKTESKLPTDLELPNSRSSQL